MVGNQDELLKRPLYGTESEILVQNGLEADKITSLRSTAGTSRQSPPKGPYNPNLG